MTYLYLFTAIVLEVIGTSALQASQQFTRIGPVSLMIMAYIASFFFLALTLKTMPVGIAYAIWSGLGIVLISLIGFVLFGQKLDFAAIFGIGLIVLGVMVVNLFSNSISH
tara:strand:- start:13486 stop:13815 length:330 start_codon:yes stop_codon:yes gene_type:complete